MLTLTFQFETVEAALNFLRAVNNGPKTENVVVMTPPRPEREVVLPDPQPEKKERKPRSDAGQPRGPYKRGGKEDSPAEAAAPATKTPVAADTPPAAAAPEAAAASATTPGFAGDPPAEFSAPQQLTLADVRAAMTGRTTEKNIALLKKFGYAKSSDLPPAKFGEFIAACKRGE